MEQLKIKIPSLVNDSPQSAAIISKLNVDQSANQRSYSQYNFTDVAASTAFKIRNNESILEILPDLELCITIVTAAMLDPNGMVDNNLLYSLPEIKIPSDIRSSIVDMIKKYIDTNYNLSDKLKDIIREAYFTKGAYIEAIIPEASLDRLINKSSQYRGMGTFNYESNDPDDMSIFLRNVKYDSGFLKTPSSFTINTESMIDQYGVATYLEDENEKHSINAEARESFTKFSKVSNNQRIITITEQDIGLEITDDIDILRLSDIETRNKVKQAKLNMESYKEPDTYNYLNILFRSNVSDAPSEVEFTLTDEENLRDSVSKPLIMKLPPESVIPIYAKNNPEKHVGYFVLLDQYGNPLDVLNDNSQDLCGMIGNSNDPKTNIVMKARHGLYGALKNVPEVNNIELLYGDIVDHMIKSRLRNEDFEGLVDIRESADIYRVMLNRALAAKQTKLLYVPMELIQYYAFEFRDNGTGLSQIEKSAILASMAGMLLFANVKSSIQGSTPITDLTLTLDEDDPNPMSTAHKIKSELIKSNNIAFPLGLSTPVQLQDWVINQGYRISVKSPYIPNMEIDKSTNFNAKGDAIDSSGETYQKIVGMIMKSLGIPPEIIENGMKEEFAAGIIMKNKLLAKRIILLQQKLSILLTDHVRKYITSDKILKDKIASIIIKNKKQIKDFLKPNKKKDSAAENELIEDEDDIKIDKIKDADLAQFLTDYYKNNIWVELPRPDFGDEDDKGKLFDATVTKIESAVDKLYSDEMFGKDISGPNGQKVGETIRAIIKSGAIRRFMVDQNYLPEVTAWYTNDEYGKLTFNYMEENSQFTKIVTDEYLKYLTHYINIIKKVNDRIGDAMEDLEKIEGDEGGFGSDSGSSDSGSYDEGSGDTEEGGSDEFGDEFGEDTGDTGEEDTGEENPEDNPDATSEEETTETTEEPKE